MSHWPEACRFHSMRSNDTPGLARLLAAAALALALSACQTGGTVTMQPPPELATAPRLDVQGRQGWLPNGALRYGPYRTEGFESGHQMHTARHCERALCWGVGDREQALRFENAVRTARQRLVFRQVDARGAAADVRALADWQVASEGWAVNWFGGAFRTTTREERRLAFFGTVTPEAAEEPAWRFWLGEHSEVSADTVGLAQSAGGRRWEIRRTHGLLLPVSPTSTTTRPVAQTHSGHVLHDGQRALAAVDMLMGGHVWIADDLPAADKLAAAGIVSALLLRDQFAPAPAARP
ncbi:MAG: hypothetical protein ACOZJX_14410 [Pseudomonadota bacterium]